jgi:glycosyltransferase involved in cell wall biosynthesis
MKNKVPLISVIMPVYNAEKYLDEAIQSILNQTFKDFEFVIINDGSTDKSKEIILSYEDERIIYIENETNLKLIKTLNKGLVLSKGKYIIRMDADDISLPNRFEKQVNFMEENPLVVVCGTQAYKFGIDTGMFKEPIQDINIRERFVIYPTFIHPSVIIRNSTIQENNIVYDKNYIHSEDYKFWLDLLNIGQGANLSEVLLKYRTSKEQISNKYTDIQVKTAQRVRREYISNYLNLKQIKFDLQNNIALEDIKTLKNYKIKGDKTIDAIVYTMYLSLDRYDFKSFIHFLFSFDYFRFPYNVKEFIRVVVKHINPSRFYKWL